MLNSSTRDDGDVVAEEEEEEDVGHRLVPLVDVDVDGREVGGVGDGEELDEPV